MGKNKSTNKNEAIIVYGAGLGVAFGAAAGSIFEGVTIPIGISFGLIFGVLAGMLFGKQIVRLFGEPDKTDSNEEKE